MDNLSKTLQRSTVSAAEGQRVAAPTLTTLEKIRTDEDFNLIWKLVQKKASHFDISEPKLPHKRKAPKRFCSWEWRVSLSTVEEHYRKYYYEVLDLIISSIRKRFDQPGFETYKNLQNLLIKAANK